MVRFLLLKVSALAVAISATALLSGCGTSSGKPELCNPGVQNARCPKVPKAKAAKRAGAGDNSSRNY